MIKWQAVNPKPDIHIRKAALSKFAQRFPDRLDIKLKLAEQHLYLGEAKEAYDLLEGVPENLKDDLDWQAAYGKVAFRLTHHEIAERCLSRAWERGSTIAGFELAKLLSAQQRSEHAIVICRAILQKDAENFLAAQLLCRNLIARDQWEKLREWAEALMRDGSWNAVLPSALAYAGECDDQKRATPTLAQLNQFPMRICNLMGAPRQTDLRDILLTHKARSNFPPIYAGRGTGARIDGVLDLGINQVTHLFEHIKNVIEDYSEEISAQETFPSFVTIPPKAKIESWANICTEDGYEDWHCHPAGGLSGVYYLDVPDIAGYSELAGQIEFGPLMLGKHNDLEAWPKKRLVPENDMLLLFPSYFGHRTYPTGIDKSRISIAFDIVPTADG